MESLDEYLLEEGVEKVKELLCVMQKHWSEVSASSDKRKEDWDALLQDMNTLPLKYEIQDARQQITEMWDKCFKSEEERRSFTLFYCDKYTSEVLKAHCEELKSLKSFYDKNKSLIEMINKYEKVQGSMLHMQEQSQNRERLFKNRGAQLLKEEQDRKLISKLPQLQDTILSAIRKKEQAGEMFLIKGQHFLSIVERYKVLTRGVRSATKRTPCERTFQAGPSAKRAHFHKENSNPNHLPTRTISRATRCLEMK